MLRECRCHQDIHFLAAHYHHIYLFVVLCCSHITIVVICNGYIRMLFCVSLCYLLIQFLVSCLPENKAQINLLTFLGSLCAAALSTLCRSC